MNESFTPSVYRAAIGSNSVRKSAAVETNFILRTDYGEQTRGLMKD